MSSISKKIIYGFEGFGGAEAISCLKNVDWYGIGRYSKNIDYDRNLLELYSFTESLPVAIKETKLPLTLLAKFDSRLLVYFDQLSRTRSGRIGSPQENKNHILTLLKWWYVKYHSKDIAWAFFAAPPHLGIDMVLSDYLEWEGVLVRWGSQSLFSGYYQLLTTQLKTVAFSGNLPKKLPELPECASEELFYMQNIKSNQPSKLKWLESCSKALLGDKRYSLKWANYSYTDGIRYCKQLHQATSDSIDTIENLISNNVSFIYFPLHLQPEMTTSTLGGIYVDQALAIEHLHEKLPKEWKIVVKENPKQTFQCRPKSFFSRIKSLKNVEFVGLEANSKLLIKHSKVVSTITGTAGWEAIRFETPTVIFGKAWYEGFEGVYSFQNEILIESIARKKINRNRLESDYESFIKSCHYGVIDSGYQTLVDFEEGENIRYLTNLFDFLTEESKPTGHCQ